MNLTRRQTGNSNIKQFAYSDYSERLYMTGWVVTMPIFIDGIDLN